MKALAKSIALSVMIAAMAAASASPSAADEYRRHHRHHNNDDLAIGAAGLAAGVLLGGALASQPRYVEPGPVYVDPGYDEPVPVYRQRPRVYVEDPGYEVRPVRSLRPWSGGWVRYCSQRYQSFDRRTGTFIGYDGREHFCTAG